ncbi:MAG: pyroglutamyl-peptidase I [Candidatus Binataceae bacterium]|nr:pyroglutamyl-peptidase I [Candidatus Binataceae bacterium]
MPPAFLLTGFAPFGGERINPSWEVAQRFDGRQIGDFTIRAARLPVVRLPALRRLAQLIKEIEPGALLGLGQAGERPAITLEQIAINLFSPDEIGGGERIRRIVEDGPDAYFARVPLGAMLSAIARDTIPAALSLTAGAFVCNAVMYAGLHALRNSPEVPAGFVHLPYATAQAARHRDVASMSMDLMERAVELSIATIVSRAGRRRANRPLRRK